MREEEIEVPYARESVMERPLSGASSRSRVSSVVDRERGGTTTPRGDGEQEMLSPQSGDDRVYYERMSFSSNVTSKSKAQAATGWDEERERKIRSEYELKIAGLERKISVLEGGREDGGRREKEEQERLRELEDEIRGLKEVRERETLNASLTTSERHYMLRASDQCSTSSTWRKMRQRQRGVTQRPRDGRRKMRSTNGEIGATDWKMSCAGSKWKSKPWKLPMYRLAATAR